MSNKYEEILAKIEAGESVEALRRANESDEEVLRLLDTVTRLHARRDDMTPSKKELKILLSDLQDNVTEEVSPRRVHVSWQRYVWRLAVPVAVAALVFVFVGVGKTPPEKGNIDSIVSVALEQATQDASFAVGDDIININGEYEEILNPLTETKLL